MGELRAAGREHTALGLAAQVLARRLDDSDSESASGLAALARQLRDTIAQAVAGANAQGDPRDELQRKREQRLQSVAT